MEAHAAPRGQADCQSNHGEAQHTPERRRGAVLHILTPLSRTRHGQHIRWAGGLWGEGEITFCSQAILVNSCCDQMFAHKNNLCIKY